MTLLRPFPWLIHIAKFKTLQIQYTRPAKEIKRLLAVPALQQQPLVLQLKTKSVN
jgi:hypothetical protein